jgi:UDP-glucuronate 4-epimerase
MKKNVLITGCAGFIGFHVSEIFLKKKYNIIGVDNLNRYYDHNLKLDRIKILKKHKNFKFYKLDITNRENLKKIFKKKIHIVIHLAAQAGVRYSLINPYAYFSSNLLGFGNVLHLSKENKVNQFIFASSSSVYGEKNKTPFNEDKTDSDNPIQAYAATKRSNEILAQSYFNLFNFKIVGLRFFTVYGEHGRPDMAIFKFTRNILLGKKIDVFNYGNHFRDFTHVSDIKDAIIKIVKKGDKIKKPYFKILNIGHGKPAKLKKVILILEKYLKRKAKIVFIKKQVGDVKGTYADISKITKFIDFKPKIKIEQGLKKFVMWYMKKYYSNKK